MNFGKILAGTVLGVHTLLGQTTQGLISGVVQDRSTGKPIPNAVVFYCRIAGDGGVDRTGSTASSIQGFYVLPSLSPGEYRLRAQAEGGTRKEREADCFPPPPRNPKFQAQEKHDLILGVAARLEVNFDLRPAGEVWDPRAASYLSPDGMVVRFFGADDRTMNSITVDTAPASQQSGGSTVSYEIDPRSLERLPLTGRDVYALLTLMPGVTASTSTGRGLGLSVNGQRPSSSNYMLDGAENNNYLITGPLSPVAPEAVQEYRISTNNFSAEYGRTSGFLANAVTRLPGNEWHGLAYFYAKNESLNAADFQQNLKGQGRSHLKETQPGFSLGGPLIPQRLLFAASFEYFRYRSRLATQTVDLPTPLFSSLTGANSLARRILEQYPAPDVGNRTSPVASVQMSPSSTLNRYFATPRFDYISASGAHRATGRLALADYDQPDAGWSPYREFWTPLKQGSSGVVVNATSTLRPGLINEARAGWSLIDIRYDQPHPEVPSLDAGPLILPGSRSFYSLRDRTYVAQFADNLLWATRRHQIKAGGGVFLRHLNNYLKVDSIGYVQFANWEKFAADTPDYLVAPISRKELAGSADGRLNLQVPKFDRTYRAADLFLFAQDNFKVTPRLSLDYGLRYEHFGPPVNSGPVKDGLVQLGAGSNFSERISSARIVFPESGNQQLYSSDSKDWAARSGFAYSLNRSAKMLLRGGFGIFYDRPFDNLWENIRNNSVLLTLQRPRPGATDYLAPLSTQLQQLATSTASSIDNTRFIHPTLFQPGLRNGYISSYFLGLQTQVSPGLTLEWNGLGSRGRRLVATDWVNRALSLPFGSQPSNLLGYLNPAFPELSYRSNQGNSEYSAMTVTARYRGTRGQLQAAYSWSHSIDNQSDPLTGEFDFTDLRRGGAGLNGIAGFSRQFDSRADRGNSDFDLRHNLVVYSMWEIPAALSATKVGPLLRDWRLSEVAALRSGLPYSVFASADFSFTGESIINNRADVRDAGFVRIDQPVTGGKRLLDSRGFRSPGVGSLGNSGRNAFSGPGFFSLDLSISRSIAVPRLREGARVVLRADAYNLLNHANLNNPSADLDQPELFGVASYGREEKSRGLPFLGPLQETARQIQIMLRVEF